MERRLLRRMVILLVALASQQVAGAALGAAEHNLSANGEAPLT
jgi:hypothetical protein